MLGATKHLPAIDPISTKYESRWKRKAQRHDADNEGGAGRVLVRRVPTDEGPEVVSNVGGGEEEHQQWWSNGKLHTPFVLTISAQDQSDVGQPKCPIDS